MSQLLEAQRLGGRRCSNKGKKRWVIQAKYRANGQVGKDAVAEAFKAMQAYGTDVCNSNQSIFQRCCQIQLIEKSVRLRGTTLGQVQTFVAWRQLSTSKHRREPRQYQSEAIEAVFQAIEAGSGRGHNPRHRAGQNDGCLTVIANLLSEHPNYVLVLAHMSDLVRQLDASSYLVGNSHARLDDGERPAFNQV